ncbi:dipeptidyl peptidase 4 [Tachysurus vachellii]|uniref:dipeptidyl peptidase 4 n=1 Tax=Tachysurus vachellii TaxID=175792 RepID=UPI00296A9C84|nr:dipeptidyl peptidase 4 [Tachysurus vachellii]
MHVGKILLGVLGAVVVVTLIAVPTAIYLNEKTPEDAKRTFTLNDYFNSSIRPRSFNMRWISDHEYLHSTRNEALLLFNVSSEKGEKFLEETLDSFKAFDYLVSADRKFVCLLTNHSKIWRHSFTATYLIYDRDNRKLLTTDLPHDVQYLVWAPAGHKLAYVWDNNVYVKSSPSSPAEQVTSSGNQMILNGIPDWVYEEEMFSGNHAMWWSPSGRFLAFAQFNDSDVHLIEYSWYGQGQYPETVSIPYPKAGTPNPTVRLFVVDALNVSKIMEILVPSALASRDHYLSTVTWVTDNTITVQWQNRTQSLVILQVYELSGETWSVKTEIKVESATGWVGRFSPTDPVFKPDGSSFYYIKSDSRGFKHIHHISGTTVTAITSGQWEVTDILKVTNDAIFYMSNEHNSHPGQRNVYKITIDGATHSRADCLTCTLMEDRCKYNSAYFSTDGTYYRLSCSGPGLPLYTLRDSRGAGSEIRVLEDNKLLESILQNIAMPSVTHGTLKIGGFDLWYQLILPPNFDKSKTYPLLIDVYAGPCSQKSDFRFRINWSTYLASTENIIVASFDGRGSGYQGDRIMHSIYKRLGTYEVEDQITAARHFIDLGYVDKDRMAIWGWSYGGYVTSMALGAGSGVFKCGMAVAPVSKWEYYDSIYTERYMLTPQENPDFYENSTVMERAKNFDSVQYLLVHGTADDNVHFQQAAQISKALVNHQVDFESMWYTDEDHSLGGSANEHVYTHMSHFLQKCFA